LFLYITCLLPAHPLGGITRDHGAGPAAFTPFLPSGDHCGFGRLLLHSTDEASEDRRLAVHVLHHHLSCPAHCCLPSLLCPHTTHASLHAPFLCLSPLPPSCAVCHRLLPLPTCRAALTHLHYTAFLGSGRRFLLHTFPCSAHHHALPPHLPLRPALPAFLLPFAEVHTSTCHTTTCTS